MIRDKHRRQRIKNQGEGEGKKERGQGFFPGKSGEKDAKDFLWIDGRQMWSIVKWFKKVRRCILPRE